jgi:hypothetical protein
MDPTGRAKVAVSAVTIVPDPHKLICCAYGNQVLVRRRMLSCCVMHVQGQSSRSSRRKYDSSSYGLTVLLGSRQRSREQLIATVAGHRVFLLQLLQPQPGSATNIAARGVWCGTAGCIAFWSALPFACRRARRCFAGMLLPICYIVACAHSTPRQSCHTSSHVITGAPFDSMRLHTCTPAGV